MLLLLLLHSAAAEVGGCGHSVCAWKALLRQQAGVSWGLEGSVAKDIQEVVAGTAWQSLLMRHHIACCCRRWIITFAVVQGLR
jgi:hypothetical protein